VISQEGRFGQYLEGMKAGFLAQKNPPEICRGVPEDAWVVFDAEDATEAAVRAFQWSCDKQAGIEAESPLEHLRETQEGGWQLDGKIRVSERGFGRDDALVPSLRRAAWSAPAARCSSRLSASRWHVDRP
jgi:hypothetical protein